MDYTTDQPAKTKIFPQKVAKSLVTSCLAYDKGPYKYHSWKIFFTQNKFMKLANNSSVEIDITAFCILYCISGPFISEYYGKLSEDIKEVINHLVTKYGIYTGITKLDKKSKQEKLTLYNIVNCFPNICCELHLEGFCGYKISPKIILGGYTLKGMKQVIFSPMFPLVACTVLITRKDTNILPQLLWVAYATAGSKPNNNLDLATLWNELQHKLNYSVVKEEKKLSYCLKWKLINETLEMDEMWPSTRPFCMLQLKKRFQHLEQWENIASQLTDSNDE